jgi:hypothetical protein
MADHSRLQRSTGVSKSIRLRIYDSFDESAPGDYEEYAGNLLAAWKDTSTTLNRSVFLILTLAAIFELLAYQTSSASFTIASFSFAKTSVVQTTLPTIISYMVLEAYVLTKRWIDLQRAYGAVMELRAPRMAENDLDLLLRPPLTALWTVGRVTSRAITSQSKQLLYSLVLPLGRVALFSLPVLFEAQAFYRLASKYGDGDIFLWCNAAGSLVLLAFALTYGLMANSEERVQPPPEPPDPDTQLPASSDQNT